MRSPLVVAALAISAQALIVVSCEEVRSAPVPEPEKKNEAYYRDLWAKKNKGRTEVRLADGTRCDVVTETHAVEVEWANKWYEGFGQSLWYGFQLNKPAGVVLILRSEVDRKYVLRIQSLAAHHEIKLKVWTIGP